MKKRLLPFALALALCLGLVVPTAFAANSVSANSVGGIDDNYTKFYDQTEYGNLTITDVTNYAIMAPAIDDGWATPPSTGLTSSSTITFDLPNGGYYRIQGFNFVEADGYEFDLWADTGWWISDELSPGTYTLTQADLRAKLPEFDFVDFDTFDLDFNNLSEGGLYLVCSYAPVSANLGTGVSIPSKNGNLLIESTTAQETMQYNGESVTVYSVPANAETRKFLVSGHTYTINSYDATVENGVIQKSELSGTYTYSFDDGTNYFWYRLGENSDPGEMHILEIICTETGETWLSGRGGTEYVFLKFASGESASSSNGTFTAGKYETWGGLALNFYGSYAPWRALKAANPGVTLKEGTVITLPATLNGLKLLSYPTAGEGETLYTVKAGDTLGSISAAYFGTSSRYMEIYNRNSDRLSKPTLIYEGQIIVLPSKTAQTQQPSAPAENTTANPASASTVKVTVSALNVRSGPGMSNGVISVVYSGDVLNIVETSGNWGKLESGGWIYLKGYTQSVETPAAPAEQPAETPAEAPAEAPAESEQPAASNVVATVKVTVSALNVRSTPSMGDNIISAVYSGDVLNIVETSGATGSWGKLESGGWIYMPGYTQSV